MTLATLVSFLCLSIALYILWQFRQMLLLLFTAVVLATALNSLIRWIQGRTSWPRGRSLLTAIALVFLGAGAFLAVVLPPFVGQFQQLIELIPDGIDQLSDLRDQFVSDPPGWFPQDLNLPEPSVLIQQISGVSSRVFSNFVAFFSSSATILLQLLLVTALTLMLAADPDSYRKLLLRLFPSGYRRHANDILGQCETALLGWLGGVSLSSLFVALLCFAGLSLLRVQFAFAHAVLAGVFNFIPNIGPALSVVFPLGVALSNSFGRAIAVVVLYVVIQNLESYVLQPTIMRHQVSLLPAATLIAQLFFANFFGPVGLVLALPLTVVSRVWIEEAWVKDHLDGDNNSAASAIAPNPGEASAAEPQQPTDSRSSPVASDSSAQEMDLNPLSQISSVSSSQSPSAQSPSISSSSAETESVEPKE